MMKKTSKLRIILDLLFLTLMVLVLIPQSTGIPIHEWASFIILIPFLFHLLVNWNWINFNTKTFFKKSNKLRFDYIFNWILYFLMLIVTVSGIVISESVLPLFNLHFQPDAFWSSIHDGSATFLMLALGIHFALHWKWIKEALKNLNFKEDFHHITKLKTIIKGTKKEFFFLILVGITLSLFIWLLDFSSWAENIRAGSEISEKDNTKKIPYQFLIYIIPFVKVTILITIPLLITNGMIKLKNKFR